MLNESVVSTQETNSRRATSANGALRGSAFTLSSSYWSAGALLDPLNDSIPSMAAIEEEFGRDLNETSGSRDSLTFPRRVSGTVSLRSATFPASF